MTDAVERRQRGLQKMAAVYGWPPMSDAPGDFFGMTADHLFADVWERAHLSVRDRRLLLVGLLMASGDFDVLALQIGAAHRLGELDADALREIVIFLANYAGWPRAAKLNTLVEELLAEQGRATRRTAGTEGPPTAAT